MLRVCRVFSSRLTVPVMMPQFRELSRRGVALTVLAPRDPSTARRLVVEACGRYVPIRIVRRPNLFVDLYTLVLVFWHLLTNRYDVLHSQTPKAGLVAMVAGYLARTPVRIHTFTGQVWEGKRGAMAVVARLADRLTGRLATIVLTDSASQLGVLTRLGVAPDKIRLIHNGSVIGVDTERFRVASRDERVGARVRLTVSRDELVLLYLGRVSIDKGVLDLCRAVGALFREGVRCTLLMAGPRERTSGRRALESELDDELGAEWVRWRPDFVDPLDYYASADIVCLASHREGLPNLVLEAASCGLPVVATKLAGIAEVIQNGKSGLLFERGDLSGLTTALRYLASNPSVRRAMGLNARSEVLRRFSSNEVTDFIWRVYSEAASSAR